MTMDEHDKPAALVSPEWLAAHQNDPDLCVIEVAGLRPEDVEAYGKGHVPGAHSWKWQEMLWDSHTRDFPSPESFAQRLGEAGIDNDTTVVFYGPGLHYNRIAPLLMVRDKAALKRWLAEEYRKDDPRWLIVAHGDVVDLTAVPHAGPALFAVD